MSPLLINPCWLLIVDIITLLCGIWHQNCLCEAVDKKWFKDMLFITAENITENTTFPSEVIYHNKSQIKLCFNILANKTNAGCCHDEYFDCTTHVNQRNDNKYTLNVNLSTLTQHDIVVLRNATYNFSCRPSKFYKSGLILQLDNCLKGGGKNIRLSLNDTLGENVSLESNTHDGYVECVIDTGVNSKNVTCTSAKIGSPSTISTTTPISMTTTSTTTTTLISTTTPISTTPTSTASISSTTTSTTTTPISSTPTSTTPITTTTPISTTPISMTTTTTPMSTTTPITTLTTPILTTMTTTMTTTTTTMTTSDGQTEQPITVIVSETLANPEEAINLINNLTSLVEKMGNSTTAAIKIGNITGVIRKLLAQNPTNMNFGFTASGDVKTFKEQNEMGLSRKIKIPKEASEMALNRSSTFAAVLLFPNMTQTPLGEENSFFFNNEILGIEMGAKISNLTETVDIQFNNVNKNGNNAICMSWDGKGNSSGWVTDGCQTVETNNSITCRCSHLTFFAILMSPIPTNISAADAKNLNQITEVGCGISMFFLGVSLFMHFLIRKNKASNAAKILINLFITMFFLNFSFLINKTIAGLQNWAACVAMAAFLHYSMLATFTWFFMQALHLYLSLHIVSANIKYYMAKVYVAGWVTPAVFVIVLLGLNKYKRIVISYDDGTSEDICWMSDSAIHYGVNIVYYAIVFIFTLIVFVVTVVQIFHFGTKAATTLDGSSTKSKLFSILGLFFLLGISWAFAFFSYGPLLIPSYYVFTIINSFQGFLLFLYYYYSSKIVPESKRVPQNSNSTVKENIYAKSPYG